MKLAHSQLVSLVHLCSSSPPLPPTARYVRRHSGFNNSYDIHRSSTTTMLAVQKPIALFSSPQAHYQRPSHSRHPSAPVVIRPTQTPGLLSLSKPAQPQQLSSRQQSQQYGRAPRSPPKSKQNRSPQPVSAQAQPVEDGKKSPRAVKLSSTSPSDKASKPLNASSPEKSSRGRQSAKPSSKEKADRR